MVDSLDVEVSAEALAVEEDSVEDMLEVSREDSLELVDSVEDSQVLEDSLVQVDSTLNLGYSNLRLKFSSRT